MEPRRLVDHPPAGGRARGPHPPLILEAALPVVRIAVTAAVLVLGGLTVLGYLDRFSSYLELATFLRPQYAVLLAAAALASALLRLTRVAAAAVVLVALNAIAIAPAS